MCASSHLAHRQSRLPLFPEASVEELSPRIEAGARMARGLPGCRVGGSGVQRRVRRHVACGGERGKCENRESRGWGPRREREEEVGLR
ncbi:hypothetical protein NDU88_006721 [Pleurodeles waltl]|uniref:Uncharacterized protein n=1 Tax=Pleurodeles waltl TaxID=8319 RepID=A0AAV7PM76_PLEWA|nr:hypothetical protein NDU88_006721 [Pleurodeles waltl]